MKRFFLAFLAAAFVAALAAAPAGAFQLKSFQTSDKNIGCVLDFGRGSYGGGARCDIREHTWKTPKTPRSCELDYGQGLAVGLHGKAGFVCAGDTALGEGPRLGAGKSVAVGPYECKVFGEAVRCVNHRTKRGFKLSRTVAEPF
jgi:hypothetical protein